MSSRRLFCVLFFCLSVICTGFSQKFGHLNLGNVVAMMPQTKSADTLLAAFQTELITKGEAMAKTFEENYRKYAQDAQSGTVPPIQMQAKEEALQKERDAIIAYDREIQSLVQQKREELLKPIFDIVQAAIEDVSKDGGYQMVFDSSVFNTLLFAVDQDDLMPLVLKKLGIKE
jgi:outer membrane protein